jgi:hypothetical protein
MQGRRKKTVLDRESTMQENDPEGKAGLVSR